MAYGCLSTSLVLIRVPKSALVAREAAERLVGAVSTVYRLWTSHYLRGPMGHSSSFQRLPGKVELRSLFSSGTWHFRVFSDFKGTQDLDANDTQRLGALQVLLDSSGICLIDCE